LLIKCNRILTDKKIKYKALKWGYSGRVLETIAGGVAQQQGQSGYSACADSLTGKE